MAAHNRILVAALGVLVTLLYNEAGAATLQFQPVTTFSTGEVNPHFIAVADYNGDGKPDLAVSDFLGKTVSVYLNQNAGVFATPIVTNVPTDSVLGDLIAGDFNEDGVTDLVVSTFGGDQVAIPLLGKGDGSFTVQPSIAGSFGFLSGRVADLNGDGHQDLLLGGNGSNYVFLGQGNGSFTQSSIGTDPGGGHSGTAVGDFNLDGHLDGVFGAPGDGTVGTGYLSVNLGKGTGSLGNAMDVPTLNGLPNPVSVDVADFNGDGKPDLLVAGNGGAAVYLGNGDATFQTGRDQILPIYAETNPGSYPIDVSVNAADLNQDGIPDAVALDATAGVLSLGLNDATGRFVDALATPYTFTVATGSYLASVADFNGDGLPDIVTGSSTSKIISLLLSKKVVSPSVVSLTSSGAAMLLGTPLTFQVKVAGAAAKPTGPVSLLDGGVQVAQQSIDATGTATFSISNLSTGAHLLTANYSGDANYAGGTSPSLNQVVTDFQIATTPGSQTVHSGASATYSLTITPSSGLSATVSVSCSGLPTYASCRPSTTSSTFSAGGAPETITVIVATRAPGVAKLRIANVVAYAGVLFGGICLWAPMGRRERLTASLASGFSIVFLLILSGCGGGGSSAPASPGTPAGTSNITMTATATQDGLTLAHTSVVTLVVQ